MSTHFDSLITGLEQERKQLVLQLGKLDEVLATLRHLRGGKTQTRRPMSPAARMKIAAAQRARWAKWRKARG